MTKKQKPKQPDQRFSEGQRVRVLPSGTGTVVGYNKKGGVEVKRDDNGPDWSANDTLAYVEHAVAPWHIGVRSLEDVETTYDLHDWAVKYTRKNSRIPRIAVPDAPDHIARELAKALQVLLREPQQRLTRGHKNKPWLNGEQAVRVIESSSQLPEVVNSRVGGGYMLTAGMSQADFERHPEVVGAQTRGFAGRSARIAFNSARYNESMQDLTNPKRDKKVNAAHSRFAGIVLHEFGHAIQEFSHDDEDAWEHLDRLGKKWVKNNISWQATKSGKELFAETYALVNADWVQLDPEVRETLEVIVYPSGRPNNATKEMVAA